MPTIINPMDAFKTFEPALRRGELAIQRGTIHPEMIVHLDHPVGEMRLTYAKMRGESVAAIAMIASAESLNGIAVFQIGYAVPQHLRKQGLAKLVAQAAIEEFTAGMKRNGVQSFYLEAIVGVKNIASHKVAEHVIGGNTKKVSDSHSGEAALQYITKVGE
jgi:predicted acetyltransferase